MDPLWYKGQHVKNGVKLFGMCFPQRIAIFNYCWHAWLRVYVCHKPSLTGNLRKFTLFFCAKLSFKSLPAVKLGPLIFLHLICHLHFHVTTFPSTLQHISSICCPLSAATVIFSSYLSSRCWEAPCTGTAARGPKRLMHPGRRTQPAVGRLMFKTFSSSVCPSNLAPSLQPLRRKPKQ